MRAPPLSYAQRRRDEALQRQRAMRQERTDLARKVAMADREKTPELELCGPSTNSCDWDLHQAFESSLHIDDSRSSLCQAGPDRGEKPKQFYSKQLMLPEWMTDVPPDLASKWN
ncbi:unnamed protein product [Ostreobium quekettii]|uniref:Snurportin-1 n=1 Tax=Ostreobium quekettii TaxID=121088 RepID=A0A8S1INH8_9CHLO|nr:unnamed protein product [Ostreobium quekettii]